MIDALYFGNHDSQFHALFQILFRNRFKSDNGSNCLLSIDDTDFKIPNHSQEYYSHKFKEVVEVLHGSFY